MKIIINEMKKEFLLLSILTSVALIVFIIFPNKQEETIKSSVDDFVDYPEESIENNMI